MTDCSLECYAIRKLAYDADYQERLRKIKCISKNNHIECFENYKDEFDYEVNPKTFAESSRILSLIYEAIHTADYKLLEHINKRNPIKEYISIDEFLTGLPLKTIRFLREKIGLEWDIEFTKKGVLNSDANVIKYALKEGCPYISWKLKMHLYNHRDYIENDKWFNEFYNNLSN